MTRHQLRALLASHFWSPLAAAEEAREEACGGWSVRAHEDRVAVLSGLLARAGGADEDGAELVRLAAALHDIGMLALPPMAAGAAPFGEPSDMVRLHPGYGARMLGCADRGLSHSLAEAVLYHHEAWDGSGYPRGLRRRDIPFAARVIALCDTYDRLRGSRPHWPGWSHDRAVEALAHGDGRIRPEMFDPDLLRVFLDMGDGLDAAWRGVGVPGG